LTRIQGLFKNILVKFRDTEEINMTNNLKPCRIKPLILFEIRCLQFIASIRVRGRHGFNLRPTCGLIGNRTIQQKIWNIAQYIEEYGHYPTESVLN